MANARLGHSFDVSIAYTDWTGPGPYLTVDTHQSVKKPLYYGRFDDDLESDAVVLAFAGVDDIEADENVVMVNRGFAEPLNFPGFTPEEESFFGISIDLAYSSILFTGITTEPTPSHPAKPLFYKHELPAETLPETVFVLDSNFEQLAANSYLIQVESVYDDTTGVPTGVARAIVVYNDLESSFDDDIADLEAYYVQYVTRDPNNSQTEMHTVLLNNEPAFTEATFTDIWGVSMKLKPWINAYLVEYSAGFYHYRFPISKTYYVRYLDNTRIETVMPAVDDKEFPWMMRVTNGAFIRGGMTYQYDYSVNEFRAQNFNPVEPYKISAGEKIKKVSQNLVVFGHKDLEMTALPADIIIKDVDGNVTYALTTDTLKSGDEYVTGVNWDTSKILSWDSNSGLVHLDLNVKDYWIMEATYYYTEIYYEFAGLNLNPLTNPEVLDYYYVFYVVPKSAANSNLGQEASIYFLKVGQDGIIRECSQDNEYGAPDISTTVVGMRYGRANPVATVTADNHALTHIFDVEYIDSFLKEYTIESNTGDNGQTHRYLVLAEIAVVKQSSAASTTLLDIRQSGGGIKEEYLQAAKEANPEVSWFSNVGIGGGMAYPAKSVAVVNLPWTLLSEYGGRLNTDQIRATVKRHMGYGSYPIIRYYGIVPFPYVDDDSVDALGGVTFYWHTETTGWTYNVYWSYEKDGQYIKLNDSPLLESPVLNKYTITNFPPYTKVYVRVTAIVNGYEGPPSTALAIKSWPDTIGDAYSVLGHYFDV